MIGSLRGVVAVLAADHCLLENNGVGYRVFMPAISLSQIKIGQEIRVITYMAVREDAILLYGFFDTRILSAFLAAHICKRCRTKSSIGSSFSS